MPSSAAGLCWQVLCEGTPPVDAVAVARTLVAAATAPPGITIDESDGTR